MICLVGMAAFGLAWWVHWLWWRWARPQQTGLRLIQILTLCVSGGVGVWQAMAAWSLLDGLLTWLVGMALAASYVMTYPPLEVASPTHLLLLALDRNPGMTLTSLHHHLDDSVLVEPRIQDLLRERLAVEEEGRLRLTARGLALARLFAAWRRLLGAPLGG